MPQQYCAALKFVELFTRQLGALSRRLEELEEAIIKNILQNAGVVLNESKGPNSSANDQIMANNDPRVSSQNATEDLATPPNTNGNNWATEDVSCRQVLFGGYNVGGDQKMEFEEGNNAATPLRHANSTAFTYCPYPLTPESVETDLVDSADGSLSIRDQNNPRVSSRYPSYRDTMIRDRIPSLLHTWLSRPRRILQSMCAATNPPPNVLEDIIRCSSIGINNSDSTINSYNKSRLNRGNLVLVLVNKNIK